MWEELDIAQIEALLVHWAKEPPVSALFAAFVGYKPADIPAASVAPPPTANRARHNYEQLQSLFGSSGRIH